MLAFGLGAEFISEAPVVPFFSDIVDVASNKIGYENFGAGLDLDDAGGPERWWFKS